MAQNAGREGNPAADGSYGPTDLKSRQEIDQMARHEPDEERRWPEQSVCGSAQKTRCQIRHRFWVRALTGGRTTGCSSQPSPVAAGIPLIMRRAGKVKWS